MAWSTKTGIEMFMSGDHIMGIQGHHEYTKDILLNLLDRVMKENLIQFRANEPSREAWMKLCSSFLKGPRLPSPTVYSCYPLTSSPVFDQVNDDGKILEVQPTLIS
ncbi:hypothetical protein MKX01_015383 [Papaver californicum]|nr:hypothetical protein MKX01_015383 [Papaver californicum]